MGASVRFLQARQHYSTATTAHTENTETNPGKFRVVRVFSGFLLSLVLHFDGHPCVAQTL